MCMAKVIMSVKFQKMMLRVALALFVCFSFSQSAMAAVDFPQAEKGVLDLRNWDFQADGALEIKGAWEFYWNKFLEPGLQAEKPDDFTYIQVPGTWLGYQQGRKTLGKNGYATYRLRILLPEKPADLGFYLKRVQDAYRIYVNGQLWMQAGNPAKTSDKAIANITREFESLKDARGEIEVVIHVSNYSSYAGGGFFNSFTIGPEDDQQLEYLTDFALDLFLSGALICLGLFLVMLHIGRFRERAYFVLYVMSFAAAIYVITANASLVVLFPAIPYYWDERLAYISGAFLIALTYEFIHQVHKRKTSLLLSQLIMYQAAAISVFVVLWPNSLPIMLIYGLGLHLLIVSIACFVEVRHVLINKIPGRWLITVGVATLVLAGAHDILNASGVIRSVYLAQFGVLLLLFSYATILAFRVNTSIMQNERLAKAISSMNDSVAIFDNRDQAEIWNDAYAQHLSKAAQKILKPGTPFIDLVRADAFSGELQDAVGREQDFIRQQMQRHYQPGEPFEMERKNRRYLYRETETPDGGRVTLAADLSFQKAKEAELRAAFEELVAANEAKNNFLSNMSHELRTPLNAINGFSDMMIKEVLGPLSEQYQEYAKYISNSGQHLLRLVTDMLDVARIETGKLEVKPEEFDLPGLLESCVQMEAEKLEARNLNLVKSIPDNIPHLYADPVRVRQIILNLMDNAIKFTEAGGEITLIVELHINGATAISVRDTGIGIVEKHIETALQKFGQVRQSHLNAHEGLGLGLSITQFLMQLHGGKLELKSQLGVGTCVTATFPSKDEAKRFFDQ